MIPSAITSHRMIPPKMFTMMAHTLGSAVMILNASFTCELRNKSIEGKAFG
jgi:hypothetical protein